MCRFSSMFLTSLTAWGLIQSPPLVSQQRPLLKACGAGEPLSLPRALQWVSPSWPMSSTVLLWPCLGAGLIFKLAPRPSRGTGLLSPARPCCPPRPLVSCQQCDSHPHSSASPQSTKYTPSICLIHPQAHSPRPCERGGKPLALEACKLYTCPPSHTEKGEL